MSDTFITIAGHVSTGCTLFLALMAGYVVQLVIRRWLEIRKSNGGYS